MKGQTQPNISWFYSLDTKFINPLTFNFPAIDLESKCYKHRGVKPHGGPQITLSPIWTFEILQVKGSPCIVTLFEFTYDIYQGPVHKFRIKKE
jgi:hypothetical protein